MLNTNAVHIWREADGQHHVEWQASDPDTRVVVELLEPSTEVSANYHYSACRVSFSGLDPSSRHYFRVSDEYGNQVLASERKLGMQGTPNFRDFGGYAAADGRRVKWGYLFRSGQLSSLSDQDLALLANLEIDLVCDFRRVEEQAGDPSRLPPQNPPRIASLPIIPGSNARFFEEADYTGTGDPRAMFDFMVEINRDFAEQQTETYGRMFRELLDIEDARILVHCAAGKDRTGFAAAIILLAVGVSQEQVMQDYMLTRRYFHPQKEVDRLRQKYQMEQMDAASVLPMLEVHEDYLSRALEVIERNYPNVEAYLEDALGVGWEDIERLRARYLD